MTNIRVGTGYDVHQLKAGLPFLLGGINIQHTKGIVAHSDGDIIFHALADALLGAAGLGDIGHFFPDTNSKYKNINSGKILSSVIQNLSTLSYQIINVDVTVVLENPKLSPMISKIKKSVALHLEIDIDRVNIKATTSERMGFVGREEGIVCQATVLIEKI
mgnify:CR=1 FL=1|tara:strand:+ start:620 stop:1102 length:483 start_codon:yes stop_codon:yes gene_type:complete